MSGIASLVRVADVGAALATHPVGIAGIVLAEVITLPEVGATNLVITLAIGIVGWQMRKLILSHETQTAEIIRLRMTLTGDPPATRGIAGDVAELKGRVDTLEGQHDTLSGVVHGMFKSHRAADTLTHRTAERSP